MVKFLKAYLEAILIFLAMLVFGLVIGYFAWGVITLTSVFTRALNAPQNAGQAVSFNLKGAEDLGLVGTAPTPPSVESTDSVSSPQSSSTQTSTSPSTSSPKGAQTSTLPTSTKK